MPKAPLIKVIGPSDIPCDKTDQEGECVLVCLGGGRTLSIYVGPGKFYDLVCMEKEREQARIKAEKEEKDRKKAEVKDGQATGHQGGSKTTRDFQSKDVSNGSTRRSASQKDRREVEAASGTA